MLTGSPGLPISWRRTVTLALVEPSQVLQSKHSSSDVPATGQNGVLQGHSLYPQAGA